MSVSVLQQALASGSPRWGPPAGPPHDEAGEPSALAGAVEPSALAGAMDEGPAGDPGDPTGGRVIVGNAEPEGETVVVGGREVVVGGWPTYEVARRAAAARANPLARSARLASRYGRRSYIGGQEALDSIVTARVRRDGDDRAPVDPLEAACERYACALENREAARGAPLVVGGGALPDEVRALADSTDPRELYGAAEDAVIFADAVGGPALPDAPPPPILPPLPVREVSVGGASPDRVEKEIADLERAVVGRAEAVEVYRGQIAATFDAAARALEAQ